MKCGIMRCQHLNTLCNFPLFTRALNPGVLVDYDPPLFLRQRAGKIPPLSLGGRPLRFLWRNAAVICEILGNLVNGNIGVFT